MKHMIGNKHVRLVRNFLLPLICLYLAFYVPLGIYKNYQDQYLELQEQPVEEKDCSELCDEAEALIQISFRLACHTSSSLHIHKPVGDYSTDDFTKGVHQPPEPCL